MQYRKVTDVEAVEWTGDNEEQILALGDDNITISGDNVLLAGELMANLGDYIVKEASGRLSVWEGRVFEASFDEVSPPSGEDAAASATPEDQL